MALLDLTLPQSKLLQAKTDLHAERLEAALKRKTLVWPARGFQVECYRRLDDRGVLGVLAGLRKRNGTLVGQHRLYFSNPPLVHGGKEDVRATFRHIVTEALVDRYARLGLPLDPDDPDPTLTAYGITADACVYALDTTYANARSGAASTFDVTTATNTSNHLGQDYGNIYSGNYAVYQMFWGWDTSSIADTDTIDAVTLSGYLAQDYSVTDFTCQAYAKDWGGTVTTADWTAGASMSGLTKVASIASSGIGATEAYKAFTSVDAFKAAISKTGNTYVMLGSSRQEAGNQPTGMEALDWYMADNTGTTKDPKLVVDSTAAGTGLCIPAMHQAYYPSLGGLRYG